MYTPGPWELDVNEKTVRIPYKGPHHCASAFGGTLDNARLIAAAPELLETLERTAKALGIAVDANGGDSKTHHACAQARAAIAKAKGEAA